MASSRELLNQVWALFRQAGIVDDLMIIEHIAALLMPKNLARSQSFVTAYPQRREAND